MVLRRISRAIGVLAIGVLIVIGVVLPTEARSGSAGEILALVDCKPGYRWWTQSPRELARTEPFQRNDNRTSTTQTARFISQQNQTVERRVSTGVEAELGGGFPFLQASIKTKFGIEVVRSKRATIGNSQTAIIGPYRAAIAAFGVYKRTFAGWFVRPARRGEGGVRNSRCRHLRAVPVVASVPLDEVGWVIRTVQLSR